MAAEISSSAAATKLVIGAAEAAFVEATAVLISVRSIVAVANRSGWTLRYVIAPIHAHAYTLAIENDPVHRCR
ncbi:MAG: hypothetical protein QOF15_4573 [Mycobacterium sp.]|nr:hypothetical protein [Mycobacterium sp.]